MYTSLGPLKESPTGQRVVRPRARGWRSWTRAAATGVLAAVLAACPGQQSGLERLVENQMQARGGRGAIEGVHSMRVELHLVEPTFEADLVYRAMRPQFARVDVSIDGQTVFTSAPRRGI